MKSNQTLVTDGVNNNSDCPLHIAFIMDGNGRWAQKRLFARTVGHREGLKTMRKVTEAALKTGVRYLSFYAFSTENWSRPQKEVDYLMRLLKKHIPEISDELKQQNIALVITGDMSGFDTELRGILAAAQTGLSGDNRGVVNVCLNYGGRNEIVSAVNKAVKNGLKVDEKSFSSLLYTGMLPDPDLLIRTGGEKRLSNFMLYQAAYTELYFLDKLWPDFTKADLEAAIEDFKHRTRKFGKIQEHE